MKVVDKIVQWHYARNLIEGSDDRSQFQKLLEEVRELAVSIETDNSPVDDIGDIVVVLINIAERNGLTLEQCLEHAYNDIKDRTGRVVDGVYVKDVVE